MIIDVPDHPELKETAIGWFNLAWGTTTDALSIFQQNVEYYEEHVGEEMSAEQTDGCWHAQRYKLNNAIALLQQAMELFLKARIAEVSPFLLIAGEPHHWPKPNADGKVSFSEFRTIDSSRLARSTMIVGSKRLPDFNSFYERARKHRNKIAHLNAGNICVEARKILLDILTAFRFLLSRRKMAGL